MTAASIALAMPTPTAAQVYAAIERCSQRIAPAWPLPQWIAVNPWWGFVHQPLPAAAAALAHHNGTTALPALAWYRDQQARGRISAEAVASARQQHAWLAVPDRDIQAAGAAALPLSIWLERRLPELALNRTDLIDHVSQHCTRVLAHHPEPGTATTLHALWCREVPDLPMPLPTFDRRAALRSLRQFPAAADSAIRQHCQTLALAPDVLEDLFTTLLLNLPGWAGHARYRQWLAHQHGRSDDTLTQLLAILLGWEVLLAQHGVTPDVHRLWQTELTAPGTVPPPEAEAWIWQTAYEHHWRDRLHHALVRAVANPPTAVMPPRLQAVFCIDVRSEPLRRALEAQGSGIETHGYAGFFGLPIAVDEVGGAGRTAQLPGLLAPSLTATLEPRQAEATESLAQRRRHRLGLRHAWQAWRRSGTGGFGLVETLGLGYALKLVRASWPAAANRALVPDGLTPAEAEQLVPGWQDLEPTSLAPRLASILRGMGLGTTWAPWVLLVGHGSESCNNPYAASLNCGACGGHRGDTHARLLARTLNQAEVRTALRPLGITIPDTTTFVAGMHHTVTDDIVVFDLPAPTSSSAQASQDTLRHWLRQASAQCRAARAPALGLGHLDATRLHAEMLRRAGDWSEIRPEWGLAGNAGFIVAPRARSRDLDLGGRCFLHDYHWTEDDANGTTLAAILTAPVVVAHWINLQYFAATRDPQRWGGGDKTLHNVVGGDLGVLEGAGGDLKTGLPWQSVHDGAALRHEPMRLAVWVEAPSDRVAHVVAQHAVLQQLVGGDWLALFVLDPERRPVAVQRLGWQAGRVTWLPLA